MRRIKVDHELKNHVNRFTEEIISAIPIKKRPQNRLRLLLAKVNDKRCIQYIELLATNYFEIINADPEEIKHWIEKFDLILDSKEIEGIELHNKRNFGKEILKAMQYDFFRKNNYPSFFQSLKIRACVYCNSQFTLVIDSRTKKGLFELDHHFPKSKYPFLSTSIFNLYPVCSNCNKSKGNRKALFELFTLNDELNPFIFQLSEISILEFLLKKKTTTFHVDFVSTQENLNLAMEHDRMFKISNIYTVQEDLINELLIKSKIYSNNYKTELSENYRDLLGDISMINRILYSDSLNANDIHKRPLSKFTQDIINQLNVRSSVE